MSPRVKTVKTKLNQKAMLAHLRIYSWSGRKLDETQTRKVLAEEKADSDAGRWWTTLCPESELKKIVSAATKVRNTHKKWTLPWMDGGLRILAASMFSIYKSEMDKVIGEYDEVIDEFLKYYPSMVAEAPQRLKGLAKNCYFPSVEEMRNKFRIRTDILPMPTASDFRVELGVGQVRDIKKGIENSIEEMTNNAMNEIWKNLLKMVTKIKDTMSNSDAKFKNSTFDNLKEFVKLIPKLNVTDDAQLEAVRKNVLETLAKFDPDDVRASEQERKKAANAAKSVLEKMKVNRKIDLDMN